jgi:hypothetical protein
MSNNKNDILYDKILKDVDRYVSGSNEIIYTTNVTGDITETIFKVPPTPQELEGLLIWLNKERLAQA